MLGNIVPNRVTFSQGMTENADGRRMNTTGIIDELCSTKGAQDVKIAWIPSSIELDRLRVISRTSAIANDRTQIQGRPRKALRTRMYQFNALMTMTASYSASS